MRKRLGVVLVAGLAATVVSVLPATAAPAPLANLTFAKVGTSPAGPVDKQVTLQCAPIGGTHPTAEAACTALIAVGGQFSLLPRAEGYGCGADYWPTTVTVTGTWRNKPVYFTKTYSNDCEASVGSNFVFHF
ncbi:SSI family serine proteinase inhibitor [Streptomyces sp. NRRL F-5123]|uniref:SSI family serine proteinase inhibitor n=1 Tax=Streptomyces sp. NRRL F-5123 TaxID=1463856 RepID=UPI0005BE01DB|nr:SSI family serine proteinase inhibitor [Streptomyces sp. NRRL F-5123]